MSITINENICRQVNSSSVKQRVERGARWLDENFPGWEGRIDLDTLELSSSEQCICGQVFKQEAATVHGATQAMGAWTSVATGFDYAYKSLFTEANSWISGLVSDPVPTSEAQILRKKDMTPEQIDRQNIVSAGLGFYIGTSGFHTVEGHFPINPEVTYGNLQAEWKRLIRERMANGTLSKAPDPVEVG